MKKTNSIKELFFGLNAKPIISKKIQNKNDPSYDYYSYGNKNPNKIFYVIRRSPGAGLFSNLTYVLNHLEIANKHNFIPVVDMENYPTIYNEKNKVNGTKNSWLYYFDQISKFSLKEVYKSKNVILTKNRFYKTFTHNIYYNKKIIKFKNKIKIKKKLIIKAQNFINKYSLDKQKTLGIHYRGTSYKDAANHPFPPTFKQLSIKIDKLIKTHNFTKIYFATEDKGMFDLVIKKYGKEICYYRSFRSKKDDAFKKYTRHNHRYKLGEEILIESLILSKCHTFLFVETNVSSFVRFINNKKQKLKEFKNGYNSSNEYVAKWLWYIKRILPSNFGGFKDSI